MKDARRYKRLSRQNRGLFWGGILSTYVGEQEYVKNDPLLRTVNTAAGIALAGCSMWNAFKMLDLYDGAEEDVRMMPVHLAKEFVIGPIANCMLLAYSAAPEDSKNKIKMKLNIE